MRFLFNPALLHFLVLIGMANLAVNVLHVVGLVGIDYVARAGEVSAIGFLVALIYTAIFERPQRES